MTNKLKDARHRVQEVLSTIECFETMESVRETPLQYALEGARRALIDACEVIGSVEESTIAAEVRQ